MPTATTTTQPAAASIASLKARSGSSSAGSAAATLRSLYPRAAKAFLQRDVALTQSLLASAFSLIHPPPTAAPDSLAAQRKKWDILRITFETTLYAAPPQDPEALPATLRANLLLSPEPLVAALHARSLHVFTPALDAARAAIPRPSAAYLPAQILVTLALAGLKLGCAGVARDIIDDWLAKRGQGAGDGEQMDEDRRGYAKVLEVYCLLVLPRLEDWDYAEDFLTYERELHSEVRQVSFPVSSTLLG